MLLSRAKLAYLFYVIYFTKVKDFFLWVIQLFILFLNFIYVGAHKLLNESLVIYNTRSLSSIICTIWDRFNSSVLLVLLPIKSPYIMLLVNFWNHVFQAFASENLSRRYEIYFPCFTFIGNNLAALMFRTYRGRTFSESP